MEVIQILSRVIASRSYGLHFLFQGFETRINTVVSTLGALFDEVKTEGAKYGDDVKYLADFTSGCKKFEPWIEKSEAKKSVGMVKPKDLQEALDQLADAKVINYFIKGVFRVYLI